jgi:cyanophycinase
VPALSRQPTDTSSEGLLVLIGGSCTPTGDALGAFASAVRERAGTIVGITVASAEPEESARRWQEDFASVGLHDATFPPFARADASSDRTLAQAIDGAVAVFLGGGDQVKLVAELSGTRSEAAMKRLFARGGVVCGTSAGAAALTALTMAGGEIDIEGELVEQYIGPGFGLLGYEAIVDTHFSARSRLQRLFVVIADHPHLLGIGIDEDTALVVRGNVGQVVGAGGVTFVDGRDSVRFDNAHDLDRGRQLTLSHLRVGIVGTNYHLNLEHRELDVLVRGEASPHVRAGARAPAGSLPSTGARGVIRRG